MLTAGTKLGRYEIRAQLGAGGMRVVHLAEDAKLRARFVRKILIELKAMTKQKYISPLRVH